MRRAFQVEGHHDFRGSGVSHAVETEQFVYVATMAFEVGANPPRRDPKAVTIADEARICLDRMQERLEAVDCHLGHVVKMTVYLSDRNYAAEFIKTYKEYEKYFPNGSWPLRTTHFVGVARDCRMELDAVAVKNL